MISMTLLTQFLLHPNFHLETQSPQFYIQNVAMGKKKVHFINKPKYLLCMIITAKIIMHIVLCLCFFWYYSQPSPAFLDRKICTFSWWKSTQHPESLLWRKYDDDDFFLFTWSTDRFISISLLKFSTFCRVAWKLMLHLNLLGCFHTRQKFVLSSFCFVLFWLPLNPVLPRSTFL